MNNSIQVELKAHISNLIEDETLTLDNQDDWHNIAFNMDYYLIGTYDCKQWLIKHGVDAFEAIDEVVTYEKECFGEVNTKMNAESVVNMYVYIQGEELMSGIDTLEELVEICND
jgi:hypothetical protein